MSTINLPTLICIFCLMLQPLASAEIKFNDTLKLSQNERLVLEHYIAHGVKYIEDLTLDKVKANCYKSCESLCWVDFIYLDISLVSYELTGDTKYLENFHRGFQLYRSIMTTGDDEFLGWYGLPLKHRRLPDNPDLLTDELQCNFRGMRILSTWVKLASSNDSYAKKMQQEIKNGLDLLENHLFPKWDKRGYYIDLGHKGGLYKGLDFPLEDLRSLSHEKLAIAVLGILSLYDATGNDEYLRRAIAIGSNLKNRLLLKDGHYEWMSWEGNGTFDIHPTKTDSWKPSWMAADPNGAWYASSMRMVMALYERNLVFDDNDLQRFIQTQKTMCWDGNMEKPSYRTVAGTTGKWVKGRFLSYALAPYDETIDQLAFAGPYEAGLVKTASSSWKGGATLSNYVRAKYIYRLRVQNNDESLKRIGAKFMSNPDNKRWHDARAIAVDQRAEHKPWLKPSEMPQ